MTETRPLMSRSVGAQSGRLPFDAAPAETGYRDRGVLTDQDQGQGQGQDPARPSADIPAAQGMARDDQDEARLLADAAYLHGMDLT